MAFGVFTGMMPIMPFQIACAVALALLFKGSKITAALGTWVSNPFNWYFLYYASYKLGAFILGLKGNNQILSSVMAAFQSGEESMMIVGKILGAGGLTVAAFLIGGLIMGMVASFPTYFIFLPVFRRIRNWRELRRKHRN